MNHSLKSKLLIAVMTPLALGWACWLTGQHLQMTRQQKGHEDLFLQEVSEQILVSMPANLDGLDTGARLTLPQGPTPSRKLDDLSYQVWVLGQRSPIVRSAAAPEQPLRPDFQAGFALTQVAGEPWRVYAVTDATGRIQVQAGRARSAMRAELAYWIKVSLKTGVGILLALGLTMGIAIHWSLRPMNRLRQTIAERDALDLAPLPTAGIPREIKPLLESFNGLLGRLAQAMQGERQFLADAAHELRTPLAALLTQTRVALRAGTQADARLALDQLAHGIERTSRLAQQLLDSARIDASPLRGDHRTVELAEVATMVVREFESMAARQRQTIAIRAESASVHGDLDDLGILVRNLVDNALRYSDPGGRVEIRCRQGDRPGTVELTVSDDGPGVLPEEHERIFERFFRGSNGNGARGSGIGLSLVARIAQAHGATLRTGEGIGGRGFGCTVAFPAAD
ncbi:ATP-binding protein [Pseudoxanthomonas putridarboris]|uniref:histidine kinase n=1 Tax=Pseudoxanthomonas putridarboris TaxID=752605 RepID=A0ABU9IYH6_9GAMM